MPEHQTTAMSAKLSLLFDLKLQRQFQVQSSLGELDDSSQPIDFPIVLNFDGFETGEQPPPGLAPEWIDVHNLGDIWHVSYMDLKNCSGPAYIRKTEPSQAAFFSIALLTVPARKTKI